MENRRNTDKMDPYLVRQIKGERKYGLRDTALGAVGLISSGAILAYDLTQIVSHNNYRIETSSMFGLALFAFSGAIGAMGIGSFLRANDMSNFNSWEEYERSRDDPNYID